MSEQKFQAQVLEKLEKIDAEMHKVDKAIIRQQELNAVIVNELEALNKMRSDLSILTENGLMQQASVIREQNRMYTDTQLAEHETAFH